MSSGTQRSNGDRRLLLWLSGAAVALVVGISLFAPASAQNDTRPTINNAAPGGAKAAFLALGQMGRTSRPWDGTLDELSAVDAGRTTLVLAAPAYAEPDRKALAEALKKFLERGGRVLATGGTGAYLLPDGGVKPPSMFQNGLCYTTPEGAGPMGAAVGQAEIDDVARWDGDSLAAVTDQQCGNDAVVVHYAVGAGMAVWWSAATPLTNAGLKNDGNLRLLMASLGDRPNVLWDEALHAPTRSVWDAARGLPLQALFWQAVVIFALLVLSFSRRRGPIREPISFPRTSPTEFAESMGALYARAGATLAATDAARMRMLRLLRMDAGVSTATIAAGPKAIAEALQQRLRGDWSALAEHLAQAEATKDEPLTPRNALALIRAMREDEARLRAVLRPTSVHPLEESPRGS